MKPRFFLWFLAILFSPAVSATRAEEANGLAPEVTDLNAEDVSYALEAKLPDLEEAFISTAPADCRDGIPVGELGVDGGDKEMILKFAGEIAAGEQGETDSFLLFQSGKLLFESYYRRGRINYPHYQMSITKSYTNDQGTSYGYFWWRADMKVGDRTFDFKTGRGAGGQFILIVPELDLIGVVTAHNKGMGSTLNTFPERVLPAFLE